MRGEGTGGWEHLQPRKCNKNVRLAGTSCKSCHGAKYFVAPTKVGSAEGKGEGRTQQRRQQQRQQEAAHK